MTISMVEWGFKFLMGLVVGAASIMTWARLQDHDLGSLKDRMVVVEIRQEKNRDAIELIKADTAVIRSILEERKR